MTRKKRYYLSLTAAEVARIRAFLAAPAEMDDGTAVKMFVTRALKRAVTMADDAKAVDAQQVQWYREYLQKKSGESLDKIADS